MMHPLRDSIFWLLAIAGTAFRIAFAIGEWAGGTALADDAYYYFVIAENLATGHGSTFDGLAPTNGYHPLWMWLLAGLLRLLPALASLLPRIAPGLCGLLDLASGVLLFRVADSIVDRKAARWVAAIWFLSPFTIYISLRGMEAALGTMLMLALLWLLSRAASKPSLARADMIYAGALLGCATLARTDQLMTVGIAASAAIAAVEWKRGRIRATASSLTWVWATAILLVVPWFGWSFFEFGNPLQVSALVKHESSIIYGSLPWEWSSLYGAIRSLTFVLFAPLFLPSRFLCGEEFRPAALAFLAGMLSLVLLPLRHIGSLLASRTSERSPEPLLTVTVFGVTYLAAHYLLFAWIERTYTHWYALPTLALLTLWIGAAWSRWLRPTRRDDRRVSVIAGAFVAFHLLGHVAFLTRLPIVEGRFSRNWGSILSAVVEETDRPLVVGAWNAGSLAWAARDYPGITVTNLDCLVNNAAYAALRDSAYIDYVVRTVDVLVEDPSTARMLLDPTEIESLRSRFRRDDDTRIYWRR